LLGVTPRDHESVTDYDPHSLLFGQDDDEWAGDEYDTRATRTLSRSARHQAHRNDVRARRRKRRIATLTSLLDVAVVVVSAWIVVPKVIDVFRVPDYSGAGTGSVRVTVARGDSASDIGHTLKNAGVVKSQKAFVDAANKNSASQNIQPGTYLLHKHMSGASALTLLLDPKSRSADGDVLVTEGATEFDVTKRLVKALGADKQAQVDKAINSVDSLGIPLGYAPTSGKLASVEGFLYPATYTIDPNGLAADALRRMTNRFADHDRSTNFAADATKLGLTPYEALIIASIAQSEAKYPGDMAKVVRVILNHLSAHIPLKIDATSRYGAMVKGLDPSKVVYATIDSPYNSYTHTGLPPTPISNPGAEAMNAAVHPATGDWLYYVNSDAEGHLFFTNDEHAFVRAAEKCRDNNWGCG
jgi:UPF0755 protein